jgi:hypothetical protein
MADLVDLGDDDPRIDATGNARDTGVLADRPGSIVV